LANSSNRIRVASLQYFIRPVDTYEQFQDQVVSLVETAQDYDCRLLVFPEYFTCQLLTLGNVKRPINEQIRDLANQGERFVKMMQDLAKGSGMYIVAGTIPVIQEGTGKIFNESYFFNPKGKYGVQGKIHMTRFETEDWFVSSQEKFKIFDTEFGKVAITICYDVEFPELARAAARHGAYILIVPSCTDDRQSFLRVRYCAQARAIENQMFVVHSPTVGSLPMVPAVPLNYGQAAILTPSDFIFSRDGILAEGVPNQESMVLGELDLKIIHEARERGTVLPLRDSQNTREVAKELEVVSL
jgi:predicted amidohydrolase